jgi:hypothetical protein
MAELTDIAVSSADMSPGLTPRRKLHEWLYPLEVSVARTSRLVTLTRQVSR